MTINTKEVKGLTPRELRLLCDLLDSECVVAERDEFNWANRTAEEAEIDTQSLRDEQQFARGFACGASSMRNIVKKMLDD